MISIVEILLLPELVDDPLPLFDDDPLDPEEDVLLEDSILIVVVPPPFPITKPSPSVASRVLIFVSSQKPLQQT